MSLMRDCEPTTHERWIHDLRNVINVLGSGITLSRRLIEKDRQEEARVVLKETERALAQCFGLINQGWPADSRTGSPAAMLPPAPVEDAEHARHG